MCWFQGSSVHFWKLHASYIIVMHLGFFGPYPKFSWNALWVPSVWLSHSTEYKFEGPSASAILRSSPILGETGRLDNNDVSGNSREKYNTYDIPPGRDTFYKYKHRIFCSFRHATSLLLHNSFLVLPAVSRWLVHVFAIWSLMRWWLPRPSPFSRRSLSSL